MSKYTVSIEPDDVDDDPNDWGGWHLYSFNRRHINFRHPDEFVRRHNGRDEPDLEPEYETKRKSGELYLCSYYEHSACRWSLRGEGSQCIWDSVPFAGILIWEGEEPPPPEVDREESARGFLAAYTIWANGEIVSVSIDGLDGEVIASCGGFYSEENAIEYLAENLPEDATEENTHIDSLFDTSFADILAARAAN